MSRFDRQIGIFRESGQKRISEVRVAVAGCGGLGCHLISDLVQAGIRRFTIIDCDSISESNLNRQFIYIGKEGRKSQIMKEWIESNSQGADVKAMDCQLSSENIDDFLKDADIAVDCLDNNGARMVLNDGILSKGIPLVHGGVESMFGQVTVVIPGKTPCLGCILGKGENGEKQSVSSSVSFIASVQSAEVLKIVTGIGEPLAGKILTADLSKNEIYIVPVGKRPDCGHCGQIFSST